MPRISPPHHPRASVQTILQQLFGRFTLVLLLLGTAPLTVFGQSETNQVYLARAQKAYDQALEHYTAHPEDTNAPWQFASACFDLADFSTNDTQRAGLAELGVNACRQVIARDSNSVAGHYYLAMDLGELAQAKAPSLAAYRLVHQVEAEFQAAATLDERFDQAGPARNLGELYFQAPSWPLSVGSHRKAREWLERAAALAPDYPENQLNLLEARIKWRQQFEAETTLQTIAEIWPAARKKYTGPGRDKDWEDWTARRTALEAQFHKVFPPAGD